MTICLVIGATGFIGGQIARAAAARGWQVRGLRRRAGAVGAIGDVPVEWRSGGFPRWSGGIYHTAHRAPGHVAVAGRKISHE